MKYAFLFLSCVLLFSCSDTDEKKNNQSTENLPLIEETEGMYTEYYPGRKQIRVQGPKDADGNRHGKWSFYSEKGKELNFTMYLNGKKHGHSYNSYPNGAPFYYGEYWADTMIGVWRTYNEKGEFTTTDYGKPKE